MLPDKRGHGRKQRENKIMIKLALLDDADGFARSVARLSFELATDLYSVVLENKANRPTLSQVLLPKNHCRN